MVLTDNTNTNEKYLSPRWSLSNIINSRNSVERRIGHVSCFRTLQIHTFVCSSKSNVKVTLGLVHINQYKILINRLYS